MSIAKPALTDWVRKNALPLTTVSAGGEFQDLWPLRKWIGEARVVGLGEANHCTSEFFRLKHRLLEFLVSELGFNLFVLEASLPESLAVNRYVLTGEGDARHSLASMPYFIWNIEEMADIVEWMRRWNASHERKVYFYGCDPYTTAPAAMFLLKYLQRRDAGTYHRVRDFLLPLACEADQCNWLRCSDVQKKRARAVISDVSEVLSHLSVYAPEDRYELGMARLHATVLDQVVEIQEDHAARIHAVRDRSMAQNLAALLELHGPDAKAVISADNVHLQLREGAWCPSPAPVGKHLRNMLGADFVMFGSGHDHGALPDLWDRSGPDATIPSSPGTLDALFAEVGPPIFALDLRAVPKEVADGFAAGPPLRRLGERKTGVRAQCTMTLWPADIREYFDALLFVRETSPSHLRPDDTYHAECRRGDRPAAADWVNLDFAEGVRHWQMLPQPSVGAYRVAVIDAQGPTELEITRSESLWPWDVYALWQAASAEPWRGKRIVVRCRASIDAAHDGSSAQLAIRVQSTRASEGVWPENYYAQSAWQRAVTWDGQRRELSLTADVDDNADTIALALIMTGDGHARFGQITIESAVIR